MDDCPTAALTWIAAGCELHQVDAVAVILSGKNAFIAAAKTRNGIGKCPFGHWHEGQAKNQEMFNV